MGLMKRLATYRQLGQASPVPMHRVPRETPMEFVPGQAVEWLYVGGELVPAVVITAGSEKVTIDADFGFGRTRRIVVNRSELAGRVDATSTSLPTSPPWEEPQPKPQEQPQAKEPEATPPPPPEVATPPVRSPSPERRPQKKRTDDRQLTLWE